MENRKNEREKRDTLSIIILYTLYHGNMSIFDNYILELSFALTKN